MRATFCSTTERLLELVGRRELDRLAVLREPEQMPGLDVVGLAADDRLLPLAVVDDDPSAQQIAPVISLAAVVRRPFSDERPARGGGLDSTVMPPQSAILVL